MWLAIAISMCIGTLVIFKYSDFLIENINIMINRLHVTGKIDPLNMILPVGISFYTFQALSYVIDVYRGVIMPETHLGYYSLYISFFPQLVAGPIERIENLLPQLKAASTLDEDDFRAGVTLLISGYFRKIVVADVVGPYVAQVFTNNLPIDGSLVFIGTLLFAVQIYCDFSGYSEIAAGSARLMGIRLMRNFNRPYATERFKDFWKRWHISLSSWFSDYVYKPLGGSKQGILKQIVAVSTVFLISGMWHGANWTFVAWGGIHAVFYIGELILSKTQRCSKAKSDRLQHYFWQFLRKWGTRGVICFAWIYFRAESLGQANYLVTRLFSPWHLNLLLQSMHATVFDVIQICLTLLLLPSVNRLADRVYSNDVIPVDQFMTMIKVYLTLTIMISWVIQCEISTNNAFIYFQF